MKKRIILHRPLGGYRPYFSGVLVNTGDMDISCLTTYKEYYDAILNGL